MLKIAVYWGLVSVSMRFPKPYSLQVLRVAFRLGACWRSAYILEDLVRVVMVPEGSASHSCGIQVQPN